MIAIAFFPLIVCVIGVLMYALCANPKLAEIGRLAFACGLLALCFAFAKHVVSLG